MPACCCFFRGRANSSKKHLNYSPSLPASSSEPETTTKKKFKVFTYRELRWATNNFHRSNKIGQGGFGAVYKGTLRDGSDVAVKVLSASSRQGIKEFLTEIHVIADVDHPNLVDLLGCCAHGDGHRILVYDLLPNGSLHRALLSSRAASDSSRKRPEMTWRVRRGACVGVARGLAFLHEELGVVHRDIKASNVLLDAGCAPKIGDFGLARLFPDNVTHISTRVAGTTGYLAPEYAWHGQLTKKSDVYSFGVLVLEIVTGKSSSRSLHQNCLYDEDEDEKVLVERVWEAFEGGKLGDMIDPALVFLPETKEEKEEAVRYMKVALLCTQAAPLRRPAMPQVVEMLERGNVRIRETEMTSPGYVVKSHHRDQDGPDKKHYSISSMLVNVSHNTVTEIAPR